MSYPSRFMDEAYINKYLLDKLLASGMYSGDAVIAATAVENNMPLYSSNYKHFKVVDELDLRVFKP